MAHQVYLWVTPIADVPLAPCHTTICIDFKNRTGEYLFSYNENGLDISPAGNKTVNDPIFLGFTGENLAAVTKYAKDLEKTKYESYNPITTNCNHFCNDLSRWLCCKSIPDDYIHQSLEYLVNPLLWPSVLASKFGSSSSS